MTEHQKKKHLNNMDYLWRIGTDKAKVNPEYLWDVATDYFNLLMEYYDTENTKNEWKDIAQKAISVASNLKDTATEAVNIAKKEIETK